MTDLAAVWTALPEDVRAELIAEPDVVPAGRIALLAKHGVPVVSVAWEGQPHDRWEVTGEFHVFVLERALEDRERRYHALMDPLVEAGKVPLSVLDRPGPAPLTVEQAHELTMLRNEARDLAARLGRPASV